MKTDILRKFEATVCTSTRTFNVINDHGPAAVEERLSARLRGEAWENNIHIQHRLHSQQDPSLSPPSFLPLSSLSLTTS